MKSDFEKLQILLCAHETVEVTNLLEAQNAVHYGAL